MIKPTPISIRAVEGAVDAGLLATLEIVKADIVLMTHNWEPENKPKWKEEGPKISSGDRLLSYTTKDTPFVWIDHGTPGPYTIQATHAPMLRFATGGMPKTRPGQLMSTAGAPGTDWKSKFSVEHPGVEKRGFSDTMAEDADKHAPSLIQENLDEVESL
jgi:hypothetical protein